MADLVPASFATFPGVALQRPTTPTFPVAPKWQFDTDTFADDGAGDVVWDDAAGTLVTWWLAALRTQRGLYPIYPATWGLDIDGVFRSRTHAEAQARLRAGVEAIRASDPYRRTREVRGFTFQWTGDQLAWSFEVVAATGRVLRLALVSAAA